MFPDNLGLLPTYSLNTLRGTPDKFVKLSNKKNINEITVPTATQLDNPLYSIPDEIQLQDAQPAKEMKRKPRKLIKTFA